MSSARPRRPTRPLRRRVAAVTALAIVVGACGPSTPALADPVEILQAGATSLGEMETLQLRGLVEGEIPLAIGGDGGAPLPLDGTTIDAEIDVAGGELALELVAPALLNLRLNLVVADGAAYLRAPVLTGETWIRQAAEGGLGGDPGAALEGLAAFLARPELAPERLPDARCAGTDCYSVRFTVPADELGAALGDLGGAIPGLAPDAIGDATVTAGVRTDNRQLATLDLEVPAGGSEPLTISLEIGRVNEPVTIEAPPPDEVTDAPGGIFGG